MNAPVFFDEKVAALLKADDLDAAAKMILQATVDKEFGFGPPADALRIARRAWLNAYEKTFAEPLTIEDIL